MNSIAKRMLFAAFALLPCACAHYAYYPGHSAYSSGYTIMHRNDYGERPDYYDNGYRRFPHPPHHDQHNIRPHRPPADSGDRRPGQNYDHPFNDGNNYRHDFDRRNRY
ncbi:MAG: hypothetical protein K9L79_04120 [Methylobacter tundripaludum]|nr:hypothetical protein [Methylobacter tundripaludum]MCK9636409.1 hypothetical protein [Methylobacter tundripaludum]